MAFHISVDTHVKKEVFAVKFTLLITQDCNLACSYCYISKRQAKMSLATAEKIVSFIFKNAQKNGINSIGFFGGEPLIEFGLMKKIVEIIESHPRFTEFEISFNVTSNGTIFSEEIAEFFIEHQIGYCISCDGDSQTQDTCRRFKDGSGTFAIVNANLIKAVARLPLVQVNAVLTPNTLSQLPGNVRYFMKLGLKYIFINTDFSAKWTSEHISLLKAALDEIADIYIDSYRQNTPVYISVIDEKIAVIHRGGYLPGEKCHMGRKEFAFTPTGNIFPCERIVYDGAPESSLCLGNVDTGVNLSMLSCHMMEDGETNNKCVNCSIRGYCIHWCGCSNYHATGYYNRAGAFLCASEKAAITVALRVIEALEKEMPTVFALHKIGLPAANVQRFLTIRN